MPTIKIPITTEHIELNQLLKLAGLAAWLPAAVAARPWWPQAVSPSMALRNCAKPPRSAPVR